MAIVRSGGLLNYRNGKEVRGGTELAKTEKNHKKAEGYLKLRIGELAAERHGGHAFVGPAQRRITVNQLLDALEEDYKARQMESAVPLTHEAYSGCLLVLARNQPNR